MSARTPPTAMTVLATRMVLASSTPLIGTGDRWVVIFTPAGDERVALGVLALEGGPGACGRPAHAVRSPARPIPGEAPGRYAASRNARSRRIWVVVLHAHNAADLVGELARVRRRGAE